jgi:hypothetical protein
LPAFNPPNMALIVVPMDSDVIPRASDFSLSGNTWISGMPGL